MNHQSNSKSTLKSHYLSHIIRILIVLISFSFTNNANCQTEIFPAGSFIINTGSSTQTIANGLRPYGLVYEILRTYHVPIKWIIGKGKAKDGKDFTYSSVDYKGGTFIIPGEYITSDVSARINAWRAAGVVGTYTTSVLTLSVTQTLTSVPKWTLNSVNISISKSFFADAGIPSTAYVMANASGLGACNDIFVMPHADPTWANHGNLYNWNRNYLGAIWAGCHAVSVLESLVNPSNGAEQMNFLTTKGLLNYNSHNDGSAPFSYFFNRGNYNGLPIAARPDDAVFQMIGNEDAAHTNGSEQVYIPSIGSFWRNTTHIGCYDSIQSNVNANASNGPAAITLYGRGFGLNTSGYVMYQGGHDIEGSNEANVSAVRQFFNFSLMVMIDKVPQITNLNVPKLIQAGNTYNVSVTANSPVGSNLSYEWTATCPGTFGNMNAGSTTFTPSTTSKNTTYTITCVVTDACSRYSFNSNIITGLTPLPVNFLNFDVKQKDQNAIIQWTTIDEDNLAEYELFRSTDGIKFENIGTIDIQTDSKDLRNYSFIDFNLFNLQSKIVFYKIKAINNDQSFHWSSIIKLNIANEIFENIELKIFPNPFTDYVQIEIPKNSEMSYRIEMVDAIGQIKYVEEVPIYSGNSIKLDLISLDKGIYYVNIKFEDGSNISKKIIKR